jgi:hypothetical protein
MATDHSMRHSEVKSICDALEVSPSARSTPAPSGGPANALIKQAAKPVSAGKTQTSPLTRAYTGVPGYKTAWPKGARQPNR